MKIRNACISEEREIQELYFDAFDKQESQLVADLAGALLTSSSTPQVINLVASDESAILGHIAFSPVCSNDGKKQPIGSILSPLAVATRHQRQGIGTLLIQEGLRWLKEKDCPAVLVYGDPAYYGRFGFKADLAKAFLPPFPLQYESGWQALVFDEEKILPEASPIRCVAPLDNPQLW